MEQEYNAKEAEENTARALELSQVKGSAMSKLQALPYRHLVTLVQSKNDTRDIIKALKRTGDINGLNDEEKYRLNKRIQCIKGWLNNHAPESVKFEIQAKPPTLNFNDKDIERIANLKEKMTSVEWNPEAIHDAFYELQESYNMPAKEYFRIMYLILLGKEKGPRLGFFLATINRDFVVKRLESY
jgi:lysyl-tRNA synthetase class 1